MRLLYAVKVSLQQVVEVSGLHMSPALRMLWLVVTGQCSQYVC
jgi:hypothetical protein